MNIAMDACTAILLAKASVLESAARTFNIILPKSVYNEILAGKEKKYTDALLAERLVKDKVIFIMDVENISLREAIKQDFGMDDGEADAIALQLQENFDAVATDNKQGRKAAKIYSNALLGSPDIITALFKRKKVSKEKAIQACDILKKEGWFNELLLERVLEDIK
jgi:predicted nucleic acid-binding protein